MVSGAPRGKVAHDSKSIDQLMRFYNILNVRTIVAPPSLNDLYK